MPVDSAHEELSGKRVLVTGAAGVIGSWLAADFARRGAELLLCDRDPAGLELLSAAISGGPLVSCHVDDLSSPGAVDRLVRSLLTRWDAPDVIINNAGIAPMLPLIETTDEVLMSVLYTNLVAPFQITRDCMKLMMNHGVHGSVINIASGLGMTVQQGSVAYSISKSALLMLTRGAAVEGGPYGIRVNAVSPGFVPATGASTDDSEYVAQARSSIPLGRFAGPEDLAGTVAFLCSNRAELITGTLIPVDGGRLAGPMSLPPRQA
jgi:3-oxoacyl-[acyl-carrier protein] reductase